MSIDCSSATSIFELGFAVSAVIALLGREREAAVLALTEQLKRLISAVNAQAAALWPTFPPVAARALLRAFPSFLPFFLFAGAVRAFATAMSAISLATLIQGAVWGTACKLTSTSLYTYVVFAFVVAPLLYTWTAWMFRRASEEDLSSHVEELADLVARVSQQDISATVLRSGQVQ